MKRPVVIGGVLFGVVCVSLTIAAVMHRNRLSDEEWKQLQLKAYSAGMTLAAVPKCAYSAAPVVRALAARVKTLDDAQKDILLKLMVSGGKAAAENATVMSSNVVCEQMKNLAGVAAVV